LRIQTLVTWTTLALLLLLPQAFSPAALAQSPAPEGVVVDHLVQEDLDGDGSPDRTTIYCRFATESDAVQVYDGSGDMVSAADWRQAVDFDDDTWVYDVGADGDADLIVVFARRGEQYVATVHDDRNADGRVAYDLVGGRVVVRETRYWTVRVTASGDWWNVDGSINHNLVAEVDGPIGTSGMDHAYVLDRQAQDGWVDLEIETRENASEQCPAYSLARAFSEISGGIPRTAIRVNVPGSVLPQVVGYVFWPHLGPGLYAPQSPWEIEPLLRMEWARAQLDRHKGLNDIVQRVPPEVGWRVYSSGATVKGLDNTLDFENPFAFYDLAADQDGWPELIIRHAYAPPGGVWYKIGDYYQAARDPRLLFQVVRYTWDRDNDGYWDYKLGLIGWNPVDHAAHFPDFGVVTIPYGEAPWVVTEGMRWDGITFVQARQAEASPEGVYEWDDILSLSRRHIFGLGDALALDAADIRPGFCGEYRVAPSSEPRLYLSPVDRQLHLVGAAEGIDRLSGARRLRYHDLDGDGYADRWMLTEAPILEMPVDQEEEAGAGQIVGAVEEGAGAGDDTKMVVEETVSSLQVAQGLLLYGDPERLLIVRSRVDPSLFETLPPRDHAEWQALGQRLREHQPSFARDDLRAMLAQFPGFTAEIEGAALDEFRLTPGGFRFLLHLRPGARLLRDDVGAGLGSLAAGSYVVDYDASAARFRARPVTPARVQAPRGSISLSVSPPQEMAWTTVRVALRNSGLLDAPAVPLRLYALPEGAEAPLLLGEQELFLPGEGEASFEQSWWPNAPGAWVLWAEVGQSGVTPAGLEVGEMAPLVVDVSPAQGSRMVAPLRRYDGMRLSGLVLLLLAAAGAAAVAIAGLVLLPAEQQCHAEGTPEASPLSPGACHAEDTPEASPPGPGGAARPGEAARPGQALRQDPQSDITHNSAGSPAGPGEEVTHAL